MDTMVISRLIERRLKCSSSGSHSFPDSISKGQASCRDVAESVVPGTPGWVVDHSAVLAMAIDSEGRLLTPFTEPDPTNATRAALSC
jgi:hypothetical protein